ncbi:MAG TPA: hypothetical protein VGB77_08035 [Abditibacteriaceae bacterium]
MKQAIHVVGRKLLKSLPPKQIKQQMPNEVGCHFQIGDREFGSVYLSPEQRNSFFICLDHTKRELGSTWDADTIEKLTSRMVVRFVDPDNVNSDLDFDQKLRASLDEWTSKLLEPPNNWNVYFGVCNLSQKGLPISVGPVTFFPLNETGTDEVRAKFEEVLNISPDSPAVKESSRQHLNKLLSHPDAHGLAKVCCVTNMSKAAQTEALQKLRRTLAILNFYADLIHVQPTVVYLPGDAAKSSQFGLAFKTVDNGRTIAANLGGSIAGIWSAMGLYEQYLAQARTYGFDRACELLTKTSLNAVENRVSTALYWAGQAAAEKALKSKYHKNLDAEREQSFLFYAICLESLFCKRREEDGATKILSNRCSILLHPDNFQSRKQLQKQIEKLYERRSDIVHQGGLRVTEEELSEIRLLASESILEMLTNQEFISLRTEVDFDQWFHAKVHVG